MVVIQEIVAALWQHDFAALANPTLWALYIWSCSRPCFWKTAAARLIFTGDSLLLLAGAIAKGVMDFVPTIAILTAAASLGCWLSYVQGAGWAIRKR
jgi:membrane protein DedA with SNARE-associated domain